MPSESRIHDGSEGRLTTTKAYDGVLNDVHFLP